MGTIEIDTTQNVGIRFQTANVLERVLARIIDGIITTILFYALLLPIGIFGVFDSSGENAWIWITLAVFVLVAIFFYGFIMESIFHGQTVGKMAMSLRVVREDGTEPSVGNYAMRFLVGVVEVTLTVGVVATVVCLASKTGQRLGDMAAGTLVVRKARKVTLAQVGMVANRPERAVKYQSAAGLSPADVSVLKEVLHEAVQRDRTPNATRVLVEAAKQRFELVLNEKTTDDAHQFLLDVLEDYNAIHGNLSGVNVYGAPANSTTSGNVPRG